MALVGTGLEDPELLTLKAVRAIEAADLVEASGRQLGGRRGRRGEEGKFGGAVFHIFMSCGVTSRGMDLSGTT